MLGSVASDSVFSLVDLAHLAGQLSLLRYDACGQSISGDYSWDAMTDELIRTADEHQYNSIILGGTSMGAGTALHAAVRFPERVKALILVTPPPAWELRGGVKTLYSKIAEKANKNTIPEFLKRIVQLNADPPEFYEQVYPGTRQRLLEYQLGFEPRYYSQIYNGGAASDFPPREQVAQINVPTLLVSLPEDSKHPVEIAQNLHQLIRGSELLVISDYASYENLQERVSDFIEKLGFNNKS